MDLTDYHAKYFAYELTRSADGSFYVRYLPAGAKPGDPRPEFLTVATYSVPAGLSMLSLPVPLEQKVLVALLAETSCEL